jgi:hypothetical protein
MQFKTFLETNTPWEKKGVGKNSLLPDLPVRMVPISSIRPVHGRNNRPAKPIDPDAPYEPLILNSRGELQDGYHRYFDLVDQQYVGEVPVVIADI